MNAVERLRRDCDRAKRAGTYVSVADLRWVLNELDRRESDLLDLIDRIEKLKRELIDV